MKKWFLIGLVLLIVASAQAQVLPTAPSAAPRPVWKDTATVVQVWEVMWYDSTTQALRTIYWRVRPSAPVARPTRSPKATLNRLHGLEKAARDARLPRQATQ